MYKMKADGVVFYDPASEDTSLHVLNPRAQFELNKIDKLTFSMLPDNVLYDGLHKMKSIITLEQDEEVIFRGRVVETKTDAYNLREVYCEGELGYLLDSLVRPYKFEGKATDLFRQLVAAHNEQVEEYKRFEVGIITAVTDEDEADTESEAYSDTLAELRQMLVTRFNGYLRIREEGGVKYLDYIKEYEDECGQAIEFGVNLVDIESKIDAGDVFSVLVPLGGYNTVNPHDPITIASVNDGKDYLEDEEAIAKYGRIVKTYKWEELTDPQEIMNKGLEHFKKMKAHRTLTIRAVDLHIINVGIKAIRPGMRVKLLSDPHGLNEPDICSKIDLVIEKPDQTEYTFGLPPESLTDNNASMNRKNNSNYQGLKRLTVEFVKTDDLMAAVINVLETANIDEIHAQSLGVDGNSSLHGSVDVGGDVYVEGDVDATGVNTISLIVDGSTAAWKGGTFITNLSVTQNRNNATVMLADGTTKFIQWVESVTITPTTAYIDYMGKN